VPRRELEFEEWHFFTPVVAHPLQAILLHNSVDFGDEGVESDADGRVTTAEGEIPVV